MQAANVSKTLSKLNIQTKLTIQTKQKVNNITIFNKPKLNNAACVV
jgi:hypothetical protein